MTGSKLTRGGTIALDGQYAQGRMSGINELSVDQMAVLGLVLRQGRPFSELAGMLDMDEGEMRRRAHEALDALGAPDGAGPPAGRPARLGAAEGAGLPAERRAEIGDYLLGQQSGDEQAATRRFLEESAAGRAWARTVSAQPGDMAKGPLADVPQGRAEETPAPEAATPVAPVGAGAAAATAPMAPVPSEAAAVAAAPAGAGGAPATVGAHG